MVTAFVDVVKPYANRALRPRPIRGTVDLLELTCHGWSAETQGWFVGGNETPCGAQSQGVFFIGSFGSRSTSLVLTIRFAPLCPG